MKEEIDLYKENYSFNNKQLNIGDEIYAVVGSHLKLGKIEDILPYIEGYSNPRIKLKGNKKPINSNCIIK